MANLDQGALTPQVVAQNFMELASIDIRRGMTLKESIEGFYASCPPLRDNAHFKRTYPACFIEVAKRLQGDENRVSDVTEAEAEAVTPDEEGQNPSPEE